MRLLQPLLDADGKVKRWPKKAAERTAVLEYFAEWFEAGKYYAEMEVNAIIGLMQTVSDICVFRREFINAKMLERVG